MKNRARGWVLLGAPFFATALWAGRAGADPAGDQVLLGMEQAMNRAPTYYFEYEATTQEPGKAEKKLELVVNVKGDKRLTEFTAPADVKGTKVLTLSPAQMYVYLPAFGKVRRIASHVADQGFLGLAFGPGDFAPRTYSGAYEAKVLAEGASDVTIAATPRAGQTTPYGKIEFTLAKATKLPSMIRYFGAEGRHVKTETRSGYTCEGNACSPGELTMTDHAKGDLVTRMTRKRWKVNQALPDDLFSTRNLEK
jgi:hypothetical protein